MTDRTTTKVKGELYVRLQDVEPAMAKATAAFEAEVERLTEREETLEKQRQVLSSFIVVNYSLFNCRGIDLRAINEVLADIEKENRDGP